MCFHIKTNKIQAKTAILLFTRTPFDEVQHKSFFDGRKDKNLLLVNRLIAHSKKVALQTDLPFLIKYSSNQIGLTFGERLANSIEQVYQLGFEQVIVIGNDCPKLDIYLLKEAHSNICDGKVVLGANNNGGIYLVALHKNQFDKAAFCLLGWETPQLHQSYIQYIENRNLIQHSLTVLQDVNHIEDLKMVVAQLSFQHQLFQFFKSLFRFFKTKPHSYSQHYIVQNKQHSFLLRGPPNPVFL